ncbi:hypothetical protein FRE64_09575 [Euhalothece natronophila Z-M001]|uniref:Uncharacterized protein n=1 Tax=Euhalothece natronophila Z-M001 TaxID=522448 RepID=A0A5B8NML0_9CHRO|nr:hypothetical protein [Euhalothece natronophila]QDZ40176.1 hypothetical protein FRE64_09575 [Euhalothece natronophila Z-M001]
MKLFNQRLAKTILSLFLLATPLALSATMMDTEVAIASDHSTLSSPNNTNLAYNIPEPESPVTPQVEPPESAPNPIEPPETMPVEPPELPFW